MERNIIHFDLDAFFVSVERKKNPKLNGKPLLIGGSSQRGVVAACSYETRAFGVHSAMPMYRAMQLCPQALVIGGDMKAYSEASHEVTEIIAANAPCFEKASIDEFYIDASGMDRYFGAFKWAVTLRKQIIRETGLPISMAMSASKLVSKVATGEYKPNAEVNILAGTEAAFLSPLPIEKLPMVGKQTTTYLNSIGIHTVKDLRELKIPYLINTIGKNGLSLWNKAHGIDSAEVVPHSEQKSISTECTFESDVVDTKKLKCTLVAMVEKVAFALREQSRLTSCVTVKIRYSNFDTQTRQVKIPYTASDQTLIQAVQSLFDKHYQRGAKLRLIGVRLSDLVYGSTQISLFENTAQQLDLYQAIDVIKHKHGSGKIMRANTMDVSKRVRMELNLFKANVKTNI